MTNYKELCRQLIVSDSSEGIIAILEAEGLWDDPGAWKAYGDNENNWSIINNQQMDPVAALVENLVNSADANLIAKCKLEGVAPDNLSAAPDSIDAALKRYYRIGSDKFAGLTATERTKLAEETCGIVATGEKKNPCYGIFDFGEGQSPEDFPDTFLSLAKSNKLSVPFVQGKFNQGSTGVLSFCGPNGFKLIVSRKDPRLVSTSDNPWGFTIIRRTPPTDENNRRTSTAEYLAPEGQIASFQAEGIAVIPGAHPDAYKENLPWGTYVKLYNYNIGAGLQTNIQFDLNYRMSSLLVSPILPIRIYERRLGYSAKTFESTLAGLELRLSESRGDSLEFDQPISGLIKEPGLGEFGYSIYALKRDVRKENYTGKDGVLFTVNGQTHGALPRTFFRTKAAGMHYLSDSLIVIVDCSRLPAHSIEDVFASSRDRLKETERMKGVKSRLADILLTNPTLKELRSRRRKEEIDAQVENNQLAENIFQKVAKASPVLNKVLIQGSRLSNPFNSSNNGEEQIFSGMLHPSYFRLQKKTSKEGPKQCQCGRTARIIFETDVQNDYLSRTNYPGSISVMDEQGNPFDLGYWFNPSDGIWTMNIEVPDDADVNNDLELCIAVHDETLAQAITETLHIKLIEKAEIPKKANGPKQVRKKGNNPNLKLPEIIEIRKERWELQTPEFDKYTGIEVMDNGVDGYDFKINMDNLYLQSEIKDNSKLGKLALENRFKYGLMFLSMAVLNDELLSPKLRDSDQDRIELVRNLTSTSAAVILAIIEGLSALDDSDLAA